MKDLRRALPDGALVMLPIGTIVPLGLDTPLLPFLKAISSWRLGLREIIEGAAPPTGAAR
jgi:hypothetical protein